MDTVITRAGRLRPINSVAKFISIKYSYFVSAPVVFIMILVGSVAGPAHASSWQLSRGLSLSLGVINSDNENLNDAGLIEQGSDTDRSISVSPYIAVSRRTSQLSIFGRAGLAYRYTDSEPDGRLDPVLSFLSTAALIDSTMWLDTAARVSRRLVNGSIIDDATTQPDDAVVVHEFSIGPRWEQQLSRSVEAAGTYQFSTVGGSDSVIQGTDAHTFDAEIVKSLRDNKTQIGLRFTGQRDSFDTLDTGKSDSLIGIAAYRFKSNLIGRVFSGRDRLKTASRNFDEDSTLYGAGISWQPTRRLFIDAAYSERVFGSTPVVSIQLQGRVSSIVFSWTRTASISQSLEFGNVGIEDVGLDAATSQADESDVILALDDSGAASFAPFASESDNINEEVAVEYRLQGRVSRFVATLSRLEQERLGTIGSDSANKIELRLSRKLFKSMQLGLNITAIDGETTSSDNASIDLRRQQAFLTFELLL